ncbi:MULTISPECIES: carbohydrate binding domain-containing protein [Streptomycetaceae]|uniref:chitinase n=1 Tax=Streptantibioticus cattleyicolor (strain ATCC 35852 / DSM 46488 / JCM 4925 / NBRC 14057 / NRRL 8057) TaxID=1003195 RepID=F8JNV0_STREN|nr:MULTISPECIES: carbohydrate binding domain-containing protein [Streptomycetaceae]AEW92682.1 Chitinase [Streptantibioticus cattleyicolor NRRL 8057 = DSM 46488]MYS57452.1 chitinase [Streptomyces sp. SID5468]CCB73039.1 putative carbohydrate binding protein [Streptantibioticus cattleyicolor NRRL 8057 = DSM 46488]
MRPARPVRAALTALATAAASAGLLVTGGGAAHAATPLPAHVFAPYFEAYNGDSPAALASASGAKYLTMAFIQAASKGSCTPYWNGDTGKPIASSSFGSDISAIKASGGDVIPSFGGYTADNTGTEIADSCTDVASIAAAYEKVITTYDISRIDLDTEDNSLTNSAGIDRRNKAIKQVEDWAAANGRNVQFSYTLPTTTSGLADSGLAVLRNAVSNGARIDVVNIMTFDYYDGATHEMATDTENAASGLHDQLASLYPGRSDAQLWGMIGVTEMPGIDDYGAAETFTTADATTVYNWAVGKGINTLSFWALQRDNGGCPGTGGSDTCSGVAQSQWQFSHTFEPFTGGGGPVSNDFALSAAPSAGSVAPGGTATAAIATSVTAGSAQTVALTASGAPSGVTVSLSPASVTAGGSATLTAKVASSVPAGTYPVTVTGTAPSGSHTTTYTLTVTGSSGGSGSLVNGDFETGSLAPWSCQSGGTVVTSPTHSGGHALQATATSGQTGECDQTLTLKPNTSYTLTGWVQGAYAYLGVSGGATASTWTSSTGWSKLTVPFTTGSSGTVTVYVHGWYGQGNVYADDLSLN